MNRYYLLGALTVITGILLAAALSMTAPHDPTLPQVVIVYSSEKGDRSFIDSAYRGLFRAQERYAFDKQELVAPGNATLAALLKTPGKEHPGLVITVGYEFADITQQLARENPDIRFLSLDQRVSGPENLRSCEISAYGGSYLAGVLAATATKTRHTGIILGTRTPVLDPFRQGYLDGVRAVDPSVAVDVQYVQDDSVTGFGDPVRGQEIARGMYEGGADVIYTVAGFSGTGAIAEAGRVPGRYIIGVDSDQTDLGPAVVLASMVKHMDGAVYDNIGMYLDGSFRGGNVVLTLRNGATELVWNPKFETYNVTVSRYAVQAQEAEERYIAGQH